LPLRLFETSDDPIEMNRSWRRAPELLMPISVVPLLRQEQFFAAPSDIFDHTDEFPWVLAAPTSSLAAWRLRYRGEQCHQGRSASHGDYL